MISHITSGAAKKFKYVLLLEGYPIRLFIEFNSKQDGFEKFFKQFRTTRIIQ